MMAMASMAVELAGERACQLSVLCAKRRGDSSAVSSSSFSASASSSSPFLGPRSASWLPSPHSLSLHHTSPTSHSLSRAAHPRPLRPAPCRASSSSPDAPSPSAAPTRPEYIPNRIDDPNYVRIFDTTLRYAFGRPPPPPNPVTWANTTGATVPTVPRVLLHQNLRHYSQVRPDDPPQTLSLGHHPWCNWCNSTNSAAGTVAPVALQHH